MSFLNSRKKARKYRDLSLYVTTEERGAIIQLAKKLGCFLQVFISAAMLSFEELDREEQIALALEAGQRGKMKGMPILNVPVQIEMAEHIEGWQFPMLSRAQVTRAATIRFMKLPADKQCEWISEAHVFVCDPRQNASRHTTPIEKPGVV